VHGFAELLSETKPKLLKDNENDPDHEDEVNHKEVVKYFKMNALAMANFTISFILKHFTTSL
jgi:hypothetical protein